MSTDNSPTSEARRIAALIDHTVLKAETTTGQIDQLCDEAREWGFAAVCVNPMHVARCAARLRGTGVKVASVCGFPLGATTPQDKREEARRALEAGAMEIDMVVRLGDLIAGETQSVRDDIAEVVAAARRHHADAVVKVILETAALTEIQIIAGCRCCAEAQADYVKTSTGFHAAGGASIDAVRLMHKHASPLKVKASGGIRDLAAARKYVQAGAARLGMSAGVAVMKELLAEN